MIEASLLNVLIIDERISERGYDEIIMEDNKQYAEELYGGNKRLYVAKKAGILICTHIDRGNGEEPIHKEVAEKYPRVVVKLKKNKDNKGYSIESAWQDKQDKEDVKKELINLIIIHQGIMEDFLKVPDIEGFIDNLRSDLAPYIVIDSGRGIPPGLPETEKFIPFSLLEDYVMKERISKYSLVRFLMRLNRRRAL